MASRSRLRLPKRAWGLLPLLCVCLCQLVASHSWVGCTDYRGPVDFYDETKCHGYPRLWETKRGPAALTPLSTGYQLGADTGYNFRASASQACQLPVTNPIDSSYTRNYPKATYEQGGLYCLAWPTKNHVAAPCTNQYIPDTALTIGRSNVNPTPATEPTQAEFSSNPVLAYFGTHTNGNIDCVGFQRSPQFCANTDKALGTGCFRVPANLPVGVYSYQWHWEFNPGEVYATCWDASVVAPGTGTGVGGLAYDPNTLTDTLGSQGTTCRTNWALVSGNPSPTPTGPSASLSVSPSATSNVSPKTFTAVWSAPVTGFASGDLSVSGGTVGNFQFSPPVTYTWDVTPSSSFVLVSASIPAGVCADSNGVANTASATVSTQHDAQKPSVGLASSISSITSSAPFTVTASFSEVVTGVALGDFVVSGGTASALNAVSTSVYTVTVTPAYTISPLSTSTSIAMGANAAQDTANNPSTAATTLVVPHGADTQKPSVVLSSITTIPSSANFTATATFSEPVTGVDLGDFVVSRGTASNVTAVSASVYTVTVTPAYSTSPPSTNTSIGMGANAAKDASNNPNTGANTLVIPHSFPSGCPPQAFATNANFTVLVANDFVHRGGGSVEGGVAAGKNVWPNGGGAFYGSVMAGEQFLIETAWGGSTPARPKAATFRKVNSDWWAIGGTAVGGAAVPTTSSVSYIDFHPTSWKNQISSAMADFTALNSYVCGLSGGRSVAAVGGNPNKASCFELTNWGGLYVHDATANGQQCHTAGVNLFVISASQLAGMQSVSITSNQAGAHSTIISVLMDVPTLSFAGGWNLFGQARESNVLFNVCGSGQLNLGRISSSGYCAGGITFKGSLLSPQLSVSSAQGCAQLRGQLVCAAFDGATQFTAAPFSPTVC